MRIIQQSSISTQTNYYLCFYRTDADPKNPKADGWLGLDCDENGNILEDKLSFIGRQCTSPEARALFGFQQEGTLKKEKLPIKIPTIGICDDCNKQIEINNHINTCHCGAQYNFIGDRQFQQNDVNSEVDYQLQMV